MVEIGVVGVLTQIYGVPPTEALAIILVDRFISVLSIIFFGGIAYFFSPIRRGKGSSRHRYRSPNRPADAPFREAAGDPTGRACTRGRRTGADQPFIEAPPARCVRRTPGPLETASRTTGPRRTALPTRPAASGRHARAGTNG